MFCPECGKESLSADTVKSFKCSLCGFRLFMNAGAAVIAIIRNEKGEVLFTRRAREPFSGMLDFPGGFVDYEESAEGALKREIKEELNLQIESLEYLFSLPNIYHFEGITYRTLDLVFSCQVNDFSPVKSDDDVSGFSFILPSEVNIEEVGLRSAKEIISILKIDKKDLKDIKSEI